MAGGATANGGAPPSNEFPDYRQNVAFKYVKRGYTAIMRHLLTLVLVPVAGLLMLELFKLHQSGELLGLWKMALETKHAFDLVTLVGVTAALGVVAVTYMFRRTVPVYLLDFEVYKPPESHQMPNELFRSQTRDCKKFNAQSIEFQERILERSGLGEQTYLPDAVRARPPAPTMANARFEAEMVMFGAVEGALAKTGLKPKDIDILVVNCSLFNPTPSLAAMLVNKFKFKSEIITYNLAGMGCSAGVIAVDLARQMLQLYPNSNALVVSTENITQNWYFGNQRSMLIPNCLFRMGGAAIVLTNRRLAAWRAKYQLMHVVRTVMGANDDAYQCIFQKEDEEGHIGVKLSKELMGVAGKALKHNITTLGPMVLPLSEQLLFFFNLIARKGLGVKLKPYIPDFKLAFDHFCIHTGGRAVVDEIERQLALTPELTKPSKQTLYRFGNTSSSSLWYILAYNESVVGVKRGDRVWQIGFGSGFKCNSAVWRSLRTNDKPHQAWLDNDGALQVHEGPYAKVD